MGLICFDAHDDKKKADFGACIDYSDIVSIQKIKGRHDAPLDIENADAQRNFLYNYYIQINLSRVNGQYMESLKLAEGKGVTCNNVFGKNEKRTQDKAIASVYFKFSHQDHDGEAISNVDQIKIVEDIVDIIKNHIKNRKSSDSRNQNTAFSGTKLNHFDLLEQNIRQNQAICSACDTFNTAFKENFL